MIELNNVAMSYGGRKLFDDMSLSLPEGSFHFLTGPSGAGKTTLLKLCSMELLPSSGQVKVLGAVTNSLDRNTVAGMRQRIGVVHQDSLFVDHLTVSENVLLPLAVSGKDPAQVNGELTELLDWVGLGGQAENKPQELSGGERQRAALARAIIQSPDVVLADEPTGNVDWEMSLKLLDLLIELNRLGKTVLCATHDMNLIRQAKSRTSAPAVFAIALALASGELASRWEAELRGTATVRIASPEDQKERQAEAVLAALKQTPGIAVARRMDDAEQQALLAPWFGESVPLEKLRLPVLIEVTEVGDGPDEEGLKQRLAAEAPGAVYDSHGRWRAPLIEAASRLRQLGLTSLVLIATVTAVTVALAASSALAANGQIIDVLRLVGAKDRWITQAFVRRFTIRAFLGALAGAITAMVVIALIPGGVETGVLSGLGFDGFEWFWPLVVPPVAAVLAFASTWVAAARRLREAG